MKNNQLNKIAIGDSSHPKARFNLSHDVNSTYQFGEVQPVLYRLMMPDSKDVVKIDSLVRLAPMVAPTFGRIKHKEWHHFIPLKDIMPHVGNMFADTTYDGRSCSPCWTATISALSYLCLIGCKMSFYYRGGTGGSYDPDTAAYEIYKVPNASQTTQTVDNLLNSIRTGQGLSSSALPFNFKTNATILELHGNYFNTIDLKYLIQDVDKLSPSAPVHTLYDCPIPVSNFDTNSWFDIVDKSVSGASSTAYLTDLDTVELDSADAVLPYTWTTSGTEYEMLIACRFSNFGKRLYKILIGLGYCLDFTSRQRVSLMPLFAFYKAWFDSFGLTRDKSWEDTACYKLIRLQDVKGFNDLGTAYFYGTSNYYCSWSDLLSFAYELGNCWVTEDCDYITAHTSMQYNSPDSAGLQGVYKSDASHPVNLGSQQVQSLGNSSDGVVTQQVNLQIYGSVNGDVANSSLSALSIKQLMRMYRWTNRNTIAGRAIEDLLRAQGYGYFLYSCRSNFIGYTEQAVTISDVVNSSDTYNESTKSGMLLGEYGGRGLSYEESKPMTFQADEFGYWIGLCAIVPESGFSSGLEPSLLCYDKSTFYQPTFDGLGYEISPINHVAGNMPFSCMHSANGLSSSFGFIPRYSGLKFGKNVNNGGFSLRSRKPVFEPYYLDKQIDVGERQILPIQDTDVKRSYRVNKIFDPAYFPVAGDFWRYVNRYPWLGQFDRIFARSTTQSDILNQIRALHDDSSYEYCIWSDENFSIHHVVNQIEYAPMLPVAESFGTGEGDEDNVFNTSLEKA